jgi:tRNA A37 threonylcarbamoyladenosine dehydratase
MGGGVIKMDFGKQYNIYNPENQKLDIIIVGAGSTGSFTALNLAKMGMNKISVIDFDVVEEHNIPNQFFRTKDIGKLKVEALSEIIKEFTDLEIETENIEIDENYNFDLTTNTLIILCVDSIEVRKLIYEKVKDYPIKLIDTRFGGEGFSIHSIDLSNESHKEKYEKSLTATAKETSCGEKSIIYTILNLASEVCNLVKKIDKEEEISNLLRREMKTYKFINGKWE